MRAQGLEQVSGAQDVGSKGTDGVFDGGAHDRLGSHVQDQVEAAVSNSGLDCSLVAQINDQSFDDAAYPGKIVQGRCLVGDQRQAGDPRAKP